MIGSLLATGCTSAEVNGLNSKDNLHCAAVLGVAGQNAERGNAPAERRRALFVGNSWYSQRVAREALETPEASQAAARARQGGAGIERLATACLDRLEAIVDERGAGAQNLRRAKRTRARIAALRATVLSYDLGEQTRRKQAHAICQRLLLPLAPGEDPCVAVQTRLPKHATVLYCCSECRRVVNSVQDNTGKDHAFNELGLSASMLTIDRGACCGHMRCAKRSSAALRTAVALEASAEHLRLEHLGAIAKTDE